MINKRSYKSWVVVVYSPERTEKIVGGDILFRRRWEDSK